MASRWWDRVTPFVMSAVTAYEDENGIEFDKDRFLERCQKLIDTVCERVRGNRPKSGREFGPKEKTYLLIGICEEVLKLLREGHDNPDFGTDGRTPH